MPVRLPISPLALPSPAVPSAPGAISHVRQCSRMTPERCSRKSECWRRSTVGRDADDSCRCGRRSRGSRGWRRSFTHAVRLEDVRLLDRAAWRVDVAPGVGPLDWRPALQRLSRSRLLLPGRRRARRHGFRDVRPTIVDAAQMDKQVPRHRPRRCWVYDIARGSRDYAWRRTGAHLRRSMFRCGSRLLDGGRNAWRARVPTGAGLALYVFRCVRSARLRNSANVVPLRSLTAGEDRGLGQCS
jgi:hypothetical protein